MIKGTVSEFHDFESRLKPAKNRFQLSAGLNLEKLNSIFSGTNNIYARLKFFKFGLWRRNLKWSSSYRVTFVIHNGALSFVWSRMKWDIHNFPINIFFSPIFGIYESDLRISECKKKLENCEDMFPIIDQIKV